MCVLLFFFSSRRRHTRSKRDWSSDVCSSDLLDTSSFITFNYDLGLDLAVRAMNSYPLYGLQTQMQTAGISVLKLHGSLNWYRSEERRVGKECRSRRAGKESR